MNPIIKANQDPAENLECPEQIWLLEPNRLTSERLDAFFYAPDLIQTWSELDKMSKNGGIEIKTGKDFTLRNKLSKAEKQGLCNSGIKLKYIEIGDVTRYGLITKYIVGTFDELPTRGEYQIRKGDILFAINNSSRGTVVRVPEEFDGAICTSGFYVIKPKTEEQGHLLWYSLRSEFCRKQIYYLAQTASQPELKREGWIKYFRIPFPKGESRKEAINQSIAFQAHLSALLNADDIRYKSS